MASRILSIFCVLLAAVLAHATRQIPSIGLVDPVGPRAFPYMLAGGLLICSVLLFIEGGRRPAGETETLRARLQLLPLVTGAAAWVAAYFVVFERLGYILATAAFLLGATTFTNRKAWPINLTLSLGLPVAAYLLFRQVFGLPLPQGVLAGFAS